MTNQSIGQCEHIKMLLKDLGFDIKGADILDMDKTEYTHLNGHAYNNRKAQIRLSLEKNNIRYNEI